MNPIGHLPVDERAARDAAAGPPVGGCPKGSHPWPDPPKPSSKWRNGLGGKHAGGINFRCLDCDWVSLTIPGLIAHVIEFHHRGPHDTERIPISAAQGHK